MSDGALPLFLRAQNLGKSYPDGQVEALIDVTLEIERGEYVAVMGPSGCGKSTLLHLLGALDRPSRGEIYFEGEPLSRIGNLDLFRSRKLGFVFQSFHLIPTLTAVENVQVPMFETPLKAKERYAKAMELLLVVGLAQRARHLPQKLSVGERQRVAIARALANDPVLLLGDEPTGNLDSRNAEEIFELFHRLNTYHGMTLVVVTHSQELADHARRIIRMRDGRIVPAEPGA